MPAKKSVKKATGTSTRKSAKKPALGPPQAMKRAAATRATQPDAKAEHARGQMKKMGGVDSQRVEEHHRMTRHKKNQ